MIIQAGHLYRHFKGPTYLCLGEAIHTETGDELVQHLEVGFPEAAKPLLLGEQISSEAGAGDGHREGGRHQHDAHQRHRPPEVVAHGLGQEAAQGPLRLDVGSNGLAEYLSVCCH